MNNIFTSSPEVPGRPAAAKRSRATRRLAGCCSGGSYSGRCCKQKAQGGAGFTLLELVVSLSVVMILSALLLGAIAHARQRANTVRCVANLRQIAAGILLYVQDEVAYPRATLRTVGPATGPDRYWDEFISAYTAQRWTNPLFKCPQYRGETWENEIAAQGTPSQFGSYSYNAWGANGSDFGLSPKTEGPTYRLETQVTSPSDMICSGDSLAVHGIGEPKFGMSVYSLFSLTRWDSVPLRYGAVMNVGFCDGHVTSLRGSVLFAANDSARASWNFDHLPHLR